MKVAVAGGHSKKAPGASKYLNEYTEDRKVASALISALKNRGCSTANCSNEKSTQSAELVEECRLANNSKADLFAAIHFNAASVTKSKRGVEVWYYKGSKKGKEYAEKVSKQLASALDLPNRGAKATTGLYVLSHTDMTAILVEVCFVDSTADAAAYKKVGATKVADVIATAITGKKTTSSSASSSKPSGSSASSFKSYKVKITAKVLNVRSGAGTNYKVVTSVKKNEVYTIVGEKMNGSTKWLKLKSGAGYISAAYTKKV